MNDREAERQTLADPENTGAVISLLVKRARTEGPAVYLEPLKNPETWKAAPHGLQDLVIERVAERIQDDFDSPTTQVWGCEITRRCQTCDGYGSIQRAANIRVSAACPDCTSQNKESIRLESLTYRLATFKHKQTGILMQLVPGFYKPDVTATSWGPHLIGQTPVTLEQYRSKLCTKKNLGSRRLKPVLLPAETGEHWLESLGLRLPSYQEWVTACRAGAITHYFWGDDWKSDYAYIADQPAPGLGSRRMVCTARYQSLWNAWGLTDTLGNVWELASSAIPGAPRMRLGGDSRSEPMELMDAHVYRPAWRRSTVGLRAAYSIPGADEC